eukprot:5744714-Pleurochrysis_carterae.AAC.1
MVCGWCTSTLEWFVAGTCAGACSSSIAPACSSNASATPLTGRPLNAHYAGHTAWCCPWPC